MLWAYGKGVAHFKESGTGVVEDIKSADGEMIMIIVMIIMANLEDEDMSITLRFSQKLSRRWVY